MPKVSGKENKAKLSKIYKICNGLKKRNGMSEEKVESCVRGIAKRWHLTKTNKKKKK
jgi:hypothetical protein